MNPLLGHIYQVVGWTIIENPYPPGTITVKYISVMYDDGNVAQFDLQNSDPDPIYPNEDGSYTVELPDGAVVDVSPSTPQLPVPDHPQGSPPPTPP
jgi:hypothetical protein